MRPIHEILAEMNQRAVETPDVYVLPECEQVSLKGGIEMTRAAQTQTQTQAVVEAAEIVATAATAEQKLLNPTEDQVVAFIRTFGLNVKNAETGVVTSRKFVIKYHEQYEKDGETLERDSLYTVRVYAMFRSYTDGRIYLKGSTEGKYGTYNRPFDTGSIKGIKLGDEIKIGQPKPLVDGTPCVTVYPVEWKGLFNRKNDGTPFIVSEKNLATSAAAGYSPEFTLPVLTRPATEADKAYARKILGIVEQ